MNKALAKVAALISLFAFIVLLVNPPVYAEEDDFSAKKKVRVGFFQQEGFHDIDSNGVRSGYGYEIVHKLAHYNDWQLEYIGYNKPVSELIAMLDRNEIDILTSMKKNDERMQKFDFSQKSIGNGAILLTAKVGNERIISGDYDSYNGMRVGMMLDDADNLKFSDFAAQKGFSFISQYYISLDDMAKALDNDEVDVLVRGNFSMMNNEIVLDEFAEEPFYIMLNKGNKELASEINQAINKLDFQQPEWRVELYNKYYSGHRNNIVLNKEEQELLRSFKDRNTILNVIVNPDRRPYSYYDGDQAKGILPALFMEMANRLGLHYRFIQVRDRADYLWTVNSGQPDIVIDARFDYHEAERRHYRLTEPILNTSLARLTLKRLDKNDYNFAALRHPDMNRQVLDKLLVGDDIKTYDSIDECVVAVRNGECDVAYLYAYTAQLMVEEDERNKLTYTLMPEYDIGISLAVNDRFDHRLMEIMDKSIRNISDDYKQRIIFNEMDTSDKPISVVSFIYSQPMVALSIILAFAALLFIALVIFVRMKTAEEKREQSSKLARFMSYVCRFNDMVMEVDLVMKKCCRYYLNDGKVCSEVVDYMSVYNNLISASAENSIIADLDREKVDEMIDGGGNEIYYEAEETLPDGKTCWYAYTIQSIPRDVQHPCNFILFKKNVDDVKKQEEQQKAVLRDALETAREASRAKGGFLSRISHEIRTPLNAVIGYMEIAKMSDSTIDKIRHCIESSELAAKHLLNIINDVLDMSSIESGRMKIAQEEFDLKGQLTTITAIFYNQAKNKQVNFVVAIRDFTEEWVIGDQMRLNQILMNLLSNAIKFTPPDGQVSLHVDQVNLTDDNVVMKFTVKDTGIGMSEEYLSRIFTPFEQENASTAQKYGGTGLGLSITKNLVNMMGGSIEVHSKQNEGTAFTVSLIFKRTVKNEVLMRRKQDFSNLRALIVDDQKNECEYVKSLFKRCNIKCDAVQNGTAAIRQLKRRQQTDYAYDICVLDWNMPGLNGIETAKQIHEVAGENMPIIIATAYDISEIEDSAKAAGVKKIIAKPLFQSSMFDLLVTIFGKYDPLNSDSVEQVIDLKGSNILLAEDNKMNMEIAVEILKKSGLNIDTASNGQEACDKFINSNPGRYQAILMDIQMPVMDGYEAAKTIRASAHQEAADIPIIAMTANAFAEDVARALACGMNDHISKPIDYHKLIKVLSGLIGEDNSKE